MVYLEEEAEEWVVGRRGGDLGPRLDEGMLGSVFSGRRWGGSRLSVLSRFTC